LDRDDARGQSAAHPSKSRRPARDLLLCRFAPSRGIGAFIAINQFDFGAAMAMAAAVNDLIATLAPR